MPEIMKLVESREARTDIPNFGPGDTVRVHVKVKEGDKERIQIFQGLVISRKGGGTRQMFTVRKVSGGVGVERMFPLYSPSIDRIDCLRLHHADRNCARPRDDVAADRNAIDSVEHLRVVDAEERRLEVEDDAGGDDRAGQTTASHFVRPGDCPKTKIAESTLDHRHLGDAR